MRYGDFSTLCDRSPLPVCRLFDNAVVPSCHLKAYAVGNAYIINLPDFVVSILAFLTTVYLGFRAHRRIGAVGRREMALLLSLFSICLVLNIAGADVVFSSPTTNKWFGVVNAALEISFFFMLMFTAFVGFQILADGSFASMVLHVVFTALAFFGFGYMAADTAFGISSGLKPSPSDPLYSPGLFTMYLVFPLVALAVYVVVHLVIVFKFLAVRRPLVWLACAIVCFAVGQVLMFVASKKICTGSNSKIDGAFFATLLNMAAVCCIYGFWNFITEDDSEEHDGIAYKY